MLYLASSKQRVKLKYTVLKVRCNILFTLRAIILSRVILTMPVLVLSSDEVLMAAVLNPRLTSAFSGKIKSTTEPRITVLTVC